MNIKMYTKQGFTLIEVLVVVIILSILVTFIYPAVMDVYQKIRVDSMKVTENNVKNNAKMYVEDCYDTATKDKLNGCSYTDILSDSGHVFLSDMIYDRYNDVVSYGDVDCEGYVEFIEGEYTVCLKCGDAYKTDNLQCTFDYEDDKITTFNFSASGAQTFQVPSGKAGSYRIELWGASGHTYSADAPGAYTSGVIKLKENDRLYVYVGQRSTVANSTAFNAGSGSGGGWPGGGATDVRLTAGAWDNQASLASRIMVAAGGGAGGSTIGSAGGGILGYAPASAVTANGTQTNGGTGINNFSAGTFGKGGNGCGGGGGYYGGGGALCVTGGASGSSYISGHTGCVGIISASLISPKLGCSSGNVSTSCSVHYSGKKFTSTVMIDGYGYSWTNVRGERQAMPSTQYGHYYESGRGNVGHGYARITYLGR